MKNVRGHFAAFDAFITKNGDVIIILLFETLNNFGLKYNFCRMNQFWATAPMDLKNHHGTKKIAKK